MHVEGCHLHSSQRETGNKDKCWPEKSYLEAVSLYEIRTSVYEFTKLTLSNINSKPKGLH